jgi:alkanesulfonate monooxygenase SsuD/methylene tetrahydromethanopterin reductase-like flavin-dependent oxidoreductase (luciferase family)
VTTSWLFDLVHYPYELEPEAFDPAAAAAVYDAHLAEWEHADKLGFEGLFLGEHHFTPYSMTPSPNVMLAAAAQRTSKMRLGIMINVLPFHEPLRLAEEIAMLDLLSHGRLECGLGRGVDAQEFMRMKMPLEEARPRFEEGLELMRKAWTSSSFAFEGKYTQLAECTIYPRPLQQPHPKIWITALSPETLRWAGQQQFPVASIFLPLNPTKAAFDSYRDAARDAGHAVGPEMLVQCRNVYIADSEQQAREEAEPAFNHLFGLFTEAALPTSSAVHSDLDSFYAGDSHAYYREFFRPFVTEGLTFNDLCAAGIMVVGTPEQVREQIVEQVRATGAGHFMSWMNFGNLPGEKARRSMELYAQHVIPALRSINTAEAHLGAASAS